MHLSRRELKMWKPVQGRKKKMDVKKGTFGMAYPDNILIPEIRLKVVMKEFCFIVLSDQHSRIIKGWREVI